MFESYNSARKKNVLCFQGIQPLLLWQTRSCWWFGTILNDVSTFRNFQIHVNILLMDKILHHLIGSLSHYLQGFIHTKRCRISSINSIIWNPKPKKDIEKLMFQLDVFEMRRGAKGRQRNTKKHRGPKFWAKQYNCCLLMGCCCLLLFVPGFWMRHRKYELKKNVYIYIYKYIHPFVDFYIIPVAFFA